MESNRQYRIVIDTNVLFEGLTKQGGASGLIIEAWIAGLMTVCVSTALAVEYESVLSRKLSPPRWQALQGVLGHLLSISEYVPIYYTWRPSSPDPGDEFVVDCGMNARAIVVTHNLRDLRDASKQLGLKVMTPVEYVSHLGREEAE
jgi:putative PIN family toxin of toxin-antitoxin system